MAIVPREVVSDVTRILSGIRFSLDSLALRSRRDEGFKKALKSAFLDFESARFDFRSVNEHRSDTRVSLSALLELRNSLARLLHDEIFRSIAYDAQFRGPSVTPRQTSFTVPEELFEGKMSVAEAVERLIEYIDTLADTPPAPGFQLDIFEATERLTRVIPPRQNVAPLKFDILDGRLVVANNRASADPIDAGNIAEARGELEKNGNRIIDQLQNSNCDKRLIESIADLQNQICSGKDIIRLGIANIGCDIICEKFGSELPDAISALLKAHTVGVSMYVAQFPEWRRFSEQAAVSDIAPDTVQVIHDATSKLISELAVHPEAVDPEVPRLLTAINRFIENPASASKRAAFAVWRSVENLVIKVFSYGNAIVRKTADKVAEDLPGAASKTIVRTLMTTAVAGAVALSPIAGAIPDASWLSRAAEIVQKQIEHLSK